MFICPSDDEHDQFIVAVMEYHDWLVDAHGNLSEDLRCWRRTARGEYICADCGLLAKEVDW